MTALLVANGAATSGALYAITSGFGLAQAHAITIKTKKIFPTENNSVETRLIHFIHKILHKRIKFKFNCVDIFMLIRKREISATNNRRDKAKTK